MAPGRKRKCYECAAHTNISSCPSCCQCVADNGAESGRFCPPCTREREYFQRKTATSRPTGCECTPRRPCYDHVAYPDCSDCLATARTPCLAHSDRRCATCINSHGLHERRQGTYTCLVCRLKRRRIKQPAGAEVFPCIYSCSPKHAHWPPVLTSMSCPWRRWHLHFPRPVLELSLPTALCGSWTYLVGTWPCLSDATSRTSTIQSRPIASSMYWRLTWTTSGLPRGMLSMCPTASTREGLGGLSTHA